MMRTYLWQQNMLAVAGLTILGLVVVWGIGGEVQPNPFPDPSDPALRRPTGHAQLISIEPFPEGKGTMCEWVPASTQTRLMALLQREQSGPRSASAPVEETRTATVIDRPPARVIRDEYATYSAVAVDPIRNEIVLQDENLFSIMVFDRLTDTPPTARMSEPKRVITGNRTKMEFNCGIYVDPKTGDIYSVANDTMDTLIIFSRQAQGNVAPDREIITPHRTWGIAVDEEKQEMFLTVEFPPQVLVYHKTASGPAEPIRILEGPRTQLKDPHGIAIDPKNKLMFVANHGNTSDPTIPGGGSNDPPTITVYPLEASGDTPPLRIIEGDRTQFNWPAHLFLDTERGDLYVANDAGDSILVFRSTDSGNAAPQRVIKGSLTGLSNPTGVFVDIQNDEVVVANMGGHSVTVYPRAANGNVAPRRTIRSAPAGKRALMIGNPGAVGYDSKRDEILVPN